MASDIWCLCRSGPRYFGAAVPSVRVLLSLLVLATALAALADAGYQGESLLYIALNNRRAILVHHLLRFHDDNNQLCEAIFLFFPLEGSFYIFKNFPAFLPPAASGAFVLLVNWYNIVFWAVENCENIVQRL